MAENPHILGDRGKTLEDEFFRKADARAIERLRELKQKADSRQALAKAAAIKNDAILDRLIDLGVGPEIVTALAIVPLVEVAWADGSLDAKERQTVLERAEKSGIAPGSADHDLLRSWLDRKPAASLLTAWTEMIRGISEQMTQPEVESLRAGLIERAQAVARASGGFLGMGSVSTAEQDVIARLESAFRSR